MIDGNWAVAVLSVLTAMVSFAYSFAVLRHQVHKLDSLLSSRVSAKEYEARQKEVDGDIEELRDQIAAFGVSQQTIASKVDKLDGKMDVLISLVNNVNSREVRGN